MLDDVEKIPQGFGNDRKPHKIRAILLVMPFLTAILYTILINERVWQGMLSLDLQNIYTY